jgi:hypothetical protein
MFMAYRWRIETGYLKNLPALLMLNRGTAMLIVQLQFVSRC